MAPVKSYNVRGVSVDEGSTWSIGDEHSEMYLTVIGNSNQCGLKVEVRAGPIIFAKPRTFFLPHEEFLSLRESGELHEGPFK